jgi:hypothetical protein
MAQWTHQWKSKKVQGNASLVLLGSHISHLKLYFGKVPGCAPLKLTENFLFSFPIKSCLECMCGCGGSTLPFLLFCLVPCVRLHYFFSYLGFFLFCFANVKFIWTLFLITVVLLGLSTIPTFPCSYASDVLFQNCGDMGKPWVSVICRLSIACFQMLNWTLITGINLTW